MKYKSILNDIKYYIGSLFNLFLRISHFIIVIIPRYILTHNYNHRYYISPNHQEPDVIFIDNTTCFTLYATSQFHKYTSNCSPFGDEYECTYEYNINYGLGAMYGNRS